MRGMEESRGQLQGTAELRRGGGGHRDVLWAAQVWCCTRISYLTSYICLQVKRLRKIKMCHFEV